MWTLNGQVLLHDRDRTVSFGRTTPYKRTCVDKVKKKKKMTFSRRKKGKEGDKCGSGCSKESSRDREGTLNKV